MSDWIDSGGDAPRSCTGDSDGQDLKTRRGSHLSAALTIGFAVLLLALASQVGYARDRGQYASANPELKVWFDSLRSGKGPCCSDADGTAVSEVDWESSGGHYRVRLEGEWVDVAR